MFDWITGLVSQTGYAGIALLMLAENVFPPIPSELIMPLAGFAAARGELSLAGVLIAGTLGSLAGALFWFWIGRSLGTERLKAWAGRHGRWLTMAPGDVDRANERFRRHAGMAVLLGRLIPAVRSLISVPAGVAGMGLAGFLAYSAIGTAGWTAFLAATGYLLQGQYEAVEAYVNPVSNVVVGLLVIGYVYRVVMFKGGEQAA